MTMSNDDIVIKFREVDARIARIEKACPATVDVTIDTGEVVQAVVDQLPDELRKLHDNGDL